MVSRMIMSKIWIFFWLLFLFSIGSNGILCISINDLDWHNEMPKWELEEFFESFKNDDQMMIKCDCSRCTEPDPNKLNVHLIPHTHDDVGWKKTVDEYYYGLNNSIQNAAVQYVLDTVIDELNKNPNRRFIYVETAFFWKWWQEQDDDIRSLVRKLVKNGQLEFVNGGWSMPDEATTHYNSLIDQSTWGLKRLNDTFGECCRPKVTWQIDPFGHSRELANLYAQMGYDALFFAREDYQDLEKRSREKTLEHVWHGSDDLDSTESDIFTGMMRNGYGPPSYHNYELVDGSAEPIVDNLNSEEYNLPKIIGNYTKEFKNFAKYYSTNQIMYPMGTDFEYRNAHAWFKNMDKLIKHINKIDSDIKIFYSTPYCYAKALYDIRKNWTEKFDDYFPYASDVHQYWTGYFTSRPALKRMERVGNNWLQACKQLDVFANNQGLFDKNITVLREAMGVLQHHDAVSGTEQQHVAYDYAKLLQIGIDQCKKVIAKSYEKLSIEESNEIQPNTKIIADKIVFCDYLNISSCDITESGQNILVQIYNPLVQELINKTIRLPIDNGFYYKVQDNNGHFVPAVIVPIPPNVKNLNTKDFDRSELVFRINIKPLGLVSYAILISTTSDNETARILKPVQPETSSNYIILNTKKFDVFFDNSGNPQMFYFPDTRKLVNFENTFHYYASNEGDRPSGAYIFRPSQDSTISIGKSIGAKFFIDYEFGLIQEVHQIYNIDPNSYYPYRFPESSWIEQVIRLDRFCDYIEFEFVVGPIPLNNWDDNGKEVVTRYKTDLDNSKIFYTDANGRQIIRRKWNYRPTWPLDVNEEISGNYYPVNSRIMIKDFKKNIQMTILNDRSQGGTAISYDDRKILNGTIELMIHRRLTKDDHFGVDEALNEPGLDGKGLIIRGRHLLIFDTIEKSPSIHRPLAQQMFMEPIISFLPIDKSNQFMQINGKDEENSFLIPFHTFKYESLLNQSLPSNVHLLTLEQWSNIDEYLLRLEHYYQKNEDKQLSKSVKINLKYLFQTFEIIQIREMTLSANQDISIMENRLLFNCTTRKFQNNNKKHQLRSSSSSSSYQTLLDPSMDITLNPMQIRTFIIKVKHY